MHLRVAQHLYLIKAAVFVLCLLPLIKLTLETFGLGGSTLGANPVEEILHRLGKWGLIFLLVTLAISPLRRWTGQNWVTGLRRMLGLYAFFYVSAHFLAYALLDQGLSLAAIGEDIAKRPYITIGIAALIFLVPLAMTSTNGMIRRLGRRWKPLHRLSYGIAVLGVWHFYWQVKEDILEPLIYAGVLGCLLGERVLNCWQRLRRRRPGMQLWPGEQADTA